MADKKKDKSVVVIFLIIALILIIFVLRSGRFFPKAAESTGEDSYARKFFINFNNCLDSLGPRNLKTCYKLFAVSEKQCVAGCQCQHPNGVNLPKNINSVIAVNFCQTYTERNVYDVLNKNCEFICQKRFPEYTLSRPINVTCDDLTLSFCDSKVVKPTATSSINFDASQANLWSNQKFPSFFELFIKLVGQIVKK